MHETTRASGQKPSARDAAAATPHVLIRILLLTRGCYGPEKVVGQQVFDGKHGCIASANASLLRSVYTRALSLRPLVLDFTQVKYIGELRDYIDVK